MSRRLRGQTTLQNLIGRNTITKKANASQRAKRSGNVSVPGPSSSAPLQPTIQPELEEAAKKEILQKSLDPGQVACPVCGNGLGTDLHHMNLHLGQRS